MLPSNTVISCTEDDMTIKEIVTGFDFTDDVRVVSFNKRKLIESSISSTRKSDTRDLILIETDYDEVKLIVTPDQKIYDMKKKIYTRAQDLTCNVKLKHVDGIDINVTKVRKITNNTLEDVYTLTVDDTQCYFAGGVLISGL